MYARQNTLDEFSTPYSDYLKIIRAMISRGVDYQRSDICYKKNEKPSGEKQVSSNRYDQLIGTGKSLHCEKIFKERPITINPEYEFAIKKVLMVADDLSLLFRNYADLLKQKHELEELKKLRTLKFYEKKSFYNLSNFLDKARSEKLGKLHEINYSDSDFMELSLPFYFCVLWQTQPANLKQNFSFSDFANNVLLNRDLTKFETRKRNFINKFKRIFDTDKFFFKIFNVTPYVDPKKLAETPIMLADDFYQPNSVFGKILNFEKAFFTGWALKNWAAPGKGHINENLVFLLNECFVIQKEVDDLRNEIQLIEASQKEAEFFSQFALAPETESKPRVEAEIEPQSFNEKSEDAQLKGLEELEEFLFTDLQPITNAPNVANPEPQSISISVDLMKELTEAPIVATNITNEDIELLFKSAKEEDTFECNQFEFVRSGFGLFHSDVEPNLGPARERQKTDENLEPERKKQKTDEKPFHTNFPG